MAVEVAGESAKPVVGADGTRVPLLRPGLRPRGRYSVSFVYLNAGTPFGRKGEFQMTVPMMDIPIGLVDWEVVVPDGYSVRAIGGNADNPQGSRRRRRPSRRKMSSTCSAAPPACCPSV